MNKNDIERSIFNLTKEFWRQHYGSFDINDEYKDKPDIVINIKDNEKIGIEITQVDDEKHMKYFNTYPKIYNKHRQENSDKAELVKKDEFILEEDEIKAIWKKIKRKLNNYEVYRVQERNIKLADCSLLIFSDRLDMDHPNIGYLFLFIENELIKNKCKYRFVVFVSTLDSKLQVMYDLYKSKNIKNLPPLIKGLVKTEASIYIPARKSYNIYESMNSDPVVNKKYELQKS